MLKSLGIFFGLLFIIGGVLGFLPGVTKDGMFFGVFMVNPPHSVMHLVSGAIFLIASLVGPNAGRLWFRAFGLFYGAVSILGFKVGAGLICGVISNNNSDSWGHAGLALVLLAIGFGSPKSATAL
jgi:Domain of unknown function (DUF4383)